MPRQVTIKFTVDTDEWTGLMERAVTALLREFPTHVEGISVSERQLMDEPMTPEEVVDVTERGDFEWVFENAMHPAPDTGRLCPWCGRSRAAAINMADHISAHHRDEMNQDELETLNRYLEANG